MSPPPPLDVSVSQVRLMFNPDTIHSVAVASNWLYLAAGPSTVARINLENPSVVEDIQIPKKQVEAAGPIKQLYVDDSGLQLLAVTQRSEHFYFADHKQTRKEFKYLSKLRGTTTTSAKFYSRKRGIALLGTSSGSLLEMSVDSSANETYFKRDMRYVSELWRSSRREPLRGVELQDRNVVISSGRNLLLWEATNARDDTLANGEVFKSTVSEQPQIIESVPSESPGRIKGLMCSPNRKALAAIFGDTHVGFQRSGEWKLVEVKHANRILLSNYHVFVLHANEAIITVINMVSETIENVIALPTGEDVKGVSQDPIEGTHWLFTKSDLYEIRLANELAGIWRALVDKNKYEEALEVAEGREAKGYVLQRYGQHELEKGDAHKGAKLLGQSDAALEPAALQVMERDESALTSLLSARLGHTKLKAQQVILTSWLAELSDEKALGAKGKAMGDQDTGTILQILKDKGYFTEYVSLLVNSGDVDEAISFYIANEKWTEALELMRQYEHKPSVYKHASVLLSSAPRQTVESWMRITSLDPVYLIPSLVAYATTYRGPTAENQALRYLRFLVIRLDNHETPVYNALVTCMCLNNESEQTLLAFLHEHASRFGDQDFVLRICLKYKRLESAVYIYTLMGLYEEAVMLCLDAGTAEMLDMGVEIADKQVTMNEELRKYLLREVVKRMITVKGAEATALRFIKLLRVDDLLSQFPDFETLNELAPEIVRNLEQTNNKLSLLNSDIDDSLQASQEMQHEISQFKKRSVLIEPGEACQHCALPLVTRKFYVFPCQHAFHGDCLGQIHEKRGMARKAKIDDGDPLAEECALCSESNIKSIDQPLEEDF